MSSKTQPIDEYRARKQALAIKEALRKEPPEKSPCPVFSLAISAGQADSWSAPESEQKAVMDAIDDICREIGWELAAGMTALDAVESVVYTLEDMGYFNAGKGATRIDSECPPCSAAIIGGAQRAKDLPTRHGVAVGIQSFKNPIRVARAFLDKDLRVRFGEQANELGRKSRCRRMPDGYFVEADRNWLDSTTIELYRAAYLPTFLEGVGVVAMDKYGDLAAAVSSGGPAGEAGDPTTMPEICAGIMCDNNCAVVCAGTNEDLAEYEPARIVCMLKRDPTETIKGAVDQVFDFLFEKDCNPHSIIAVDRTGAIEIRSNTRVHLVSTCSNLAGSWTRVHGNSTPVTPHHLIRCDAFLEAGFTRYPICEGQIVATLKDCSNLSDLNYSQFMQTMVSIWSMSLALSASLDATFVGLACNGTGTLSLLPFDDKEKNWAGKHYERMQRDTNLPYLTSKKGEDIYSAGLTAMVHKKLGAAEPKDFSIKGETDENNYYTRVIRGQVTHHRIWEDHEHVAFLDPHGSSVGMTILVPRKQIRGDVFSMKSANFVSLMRATYKVIQVLRDGLEDDRVGVFFDGYDESFASVILIPTRDPVKENCAPNRVGKAQFYDIHPGYLSTQIGRRIQGFSDLTDLKENYLRLEESKKGEKDARDARDAKIAKGGKEGKEGKEMKETKVSLLKSQSRKVSSLRLSWPFKKTK